MGAPIKADLHARRSEPSATGSLETVTLSKQGSSGRKAPPCKQPSLERGHVEIVVRANGFCVHQWVGFGLLRLNEATRRSARNGRGQVELALGLPSWVPAAVKSSQRSPVEAVLECL